MSENWIRIASELDTYGCATLPSLLRPAECRSLTDSYALGIIFTTPNR